MILRHLEFHLCNHQGQIIKICFITSLHQENESSLLWWARQNCSKLGYLYCTQERRLWFFTSCPGKVSRAYCKCEHGSYKSPYGYFTSYFSKTNRHMLCSCKKETFFVYCIKLNLVKNHRCNKLYTFN